MERAERYDEARVCSLVGASLALSISLGCIADSRRGADTTEADAEVVETVSDSVEDLAVEVDVPSPEVIDVIDAPDLQETSDTLTDTTAEETLDIAETTEVEAVECRNRPDCLDGEGENECRRWECVDNRCVLQARNEDGPCQDGDLCTLDDTCKGGVCTPGLDQPICPEDPLASGCRLPRCEPARGCVLVPAVAGTPCSDGTASDTCVDGGFLEPDRCDDAGACVSAEPPNPITSGVPLLEGDWFMVYTTFGRYRALTAARAVVRMTTANQHFTIAATHEFGDVPFGDGDGGYLCAKTDGTLHAQLPLGKLVGHQLDEQLAVLTDTTSDGIAMLMRADLGSAAEVDGSYAYFQTTIVFGQTVATTWQGTMQFEQGCLESGELFPDPEHGLSYDFAIGINGDCFHSLSDANEAELFVMQTGVRAKSGPATIYPIYYRGAILAGGDVVLLVKETDATSRALEYGITLLVRRGASFNQSGLAGAWRYNLHAQRDNELPRRDVGSVVWNSAGTITGGVLGTLDGTVLDAAGWATIDAVGLGLSQKVALAGVSPLYQSVVVAPSGRFIVGWLVAPPGGSSDRPVSLDDTPLGGSMLLMLRPQ